MVNNRVDVEVAEKVIGANSYKNRIEYYLEPIKKIDSGGTVINPPGNESKPQEPTCEECVFQKDGYCNRYPQRYVVKSQAGYLPACGEFDDGELYCDECGGK